MLGRSCPTGSRIGWSGVGHVARWRDNKGIYVYTPELGALDTVMVVPFSYRGLTSPVPQTKTERTTDRQPAARSAKPVATDRGAVPLNNMESTKLIRRGQNLNKTHILKQLPRRIRMRRQTG